MHAEHTKNFSGAEIMGLVKSAISFAVNRQINMNDTSKRIDETNLKASNFKSKESSGQDITHTRPMSYVRRIFTSGLEFNKQVKQLWLLLVSRLC